MFHALEDLIRQSQPRPGSRIPEDLLAAVSPRTDVVLVERIDPGRAPTRRHQVIDVDGLAAIVEAHGRVLALMSQAQWAARGEGCPWRRVGASGAQPIPDRGNRAEPRTYLRRAETGDAVDL